MFDEQNKIFSEIASYVIKSELDSKWNKALLKIAIIEDSVEFNLNFSYESNKKNTKLNGAFMCSREVHKLYELTQNHPLQHKNWNRAVFTLFPDNKFDMEYIWDQELQDEVDGYNKELS